MKSGHHGQIAGFTLSGHILQNLSIMDALSDSFGRLPMALLDSRAPILHAIRNKRKQFLHQPMVYNFLGDDWIGGGWRLYSKSEAFGRGAFLIGCRQRPLASSRPTPAIPDHQFHVPFDAILPHPAHVSHPAPSVTCKHIRRIQPHHIPLDCILVYPVFNTPIPP